MKRPLLIIIESIMDVRTTLYWRLAKLNTLIRIQYCLSFKLPLSSLDCRNQPMSPTLTLTYSKDTYSQHMNISPNFIMIPESLTNSKNTHSFKIGEKCALCKRRLRYNLRRATAKDFAFLVPAMKPAFRMNYNISKFQKFKSILLMIDNIILLSFK